MKVAKIILIALVVIGIIALASLAVKDKFSKSSSNSVTGNVAFPITGFAGEGDVCYPCSLDSTTPCDEMSWEDGKIYPYCIGGQCVECTDDSQCTSSKGSGYVCADNSCVPGCSDSSDCPDPNAYYCDTWSNGIPGTCELYCGDGECNNGEDENSCSQDCTSNTCDSCSGCSPAPDWCGTTDPCAGLLGTELTCCMTPGDPICDPCNGDPCCGDACCLSGYDSVICGYVDPNYCNPSTPGCPGYV